MIWFDLDDTLWDMTGNSVVCLRELYEAHKLGRFFDSPEQWDEVYHRINSGLWEQYSRGEITRDFLRVERFARPLRLVGVAEDDALAMSEIFDKEYLDRLGSKTALIDGARELLECLKSAGCRLGIVSNGFREVQYRKMKSSGIDGYFDIVVLSDDAGVNKPDVRFFRYAEERAGTQSERNIIIGDNFHTDILGALSAGWDAVWYNPAGAFLAEDLNPAYCQRLAIIKKIEDFKSYLI